MFDWNDSYSVKIADIDAQHQKLFRICHDLHEAMMVGRAQATVAETVDKLVQYVQVHFTYEERLMRDAGFPNYLAHKALHQELTRQVLQFQKDLQDKKTVTVTLLPFLKKWLVEHIMTEDLKYAPFVKAA